MFQEKVPTLLKGLFVNTPKWDVFINHKINAGDKLRADTPTLSVIWYDENFYTRYPEMIEFRNMLTQQFGEGMVWDEPVAIVSENNLEQSGLNRHNDKYRQVHLACVGSSHWYFWDAENNQTQLVAEAGDVVYIPKEYDHAVSSLDKERAAITYTIYNL